MSERYHCSRGAARPTAEPLEPRLVLSTILWDGGGDGTAWHDPLNWDGDVLPGPADDAIIDVAADPVIFVGSPVDVGSVLSRERMQFHTSARLTIHGASEFHADVVMNPSSGVHGEGDATFHAILDTTSAGYSGSGLLTVSPTGLFRFAGFATIARNVSLEGATEWKALKATLGAGVTVTNLGDLTADSSSLLEIVSSGGTATFSQEGSFTKRGTGEMRFSTSSNLVRFDNHGPISVEAGTLTLAGPGTHDAATTIIAGATFRLVGNPQLEPGATISGLGTLALGHTDVDVPIDVGELRIVSGTARIMTTDLQVAGTVTIDGGFLELHADTSLHTVALISSGIAGPANLTVTTLLTWERAGLQGTGSLIIADTALAEITGPANQITLSRPVFNYGVIDWTGGSFGDNLAQPIENYGLMVIRPESSLEGPWVRNFGEVRKRGGGSATMSLPFENHGTFVVESGGIILDGGGGSTTPIALDGGTLTIGDELFSLPAEAPITGLGSLRFEGAARQQAYGAIDVPELFVGGFVEFFADVTTDTGFSMYGGEAVFHAGADFGLNQPLSYTGNFLDFGANDLSFTTGHIAGILSTSGLLGFAADVTWRYGEIVGGGLLHIGGAATLWMTEDYRHALGVDVVNDGRIVWSYHELELRAVTIESNGVIELQVPGAATTTGTGELINRGTLIKTGAGGASVGRRFGEVVFHNPGVVLVEQGTLFVAEAAEFDAATGRLSGGEWSVSGFATIDFEFVPFLSIGEGAVLRILGENCEVQAIDGLDTVLGTLELLDRASLAVTPTGGVFSQSGTIRLDAGSLLSISGALQQTADAETIVVVESTHPFLGFGRLVAASAVIDGALIVLADGYMPDEGAMHRIVQVGSRSGEFDALTLPPAAPGDKWAVRYDADGVTLLHTDFTDMDLNGIVDTRDFLVFLNLWVADDPEADSNGDGAVDVLDFLFWLNAWNDG